MENQMSDWKDRLQDGLDQWMLLFALPTGIVIGGVSVLCIWMLFT